MLQLLLPARCAACREPGEPCCARCRSAFSGPWPLVGGSMAIGGARYAMAGYRGVARKLVLSYKERGRRDLAVPLGRVLAAGVLSLAAGAPAARTDPVYLVPVPSKASASRARGGPHVRRLAVECAVALAAAGRAASVAPALRITGRVRDSVGMDAGERAENIAGKIRAVPAGSPPPGTPVVLLDDVLTTGTTAAAAVRALARVGVPVGAVLALTSPCANEWISGWERGAA